MDEPTWIDLLPPLILAAGDGDLDAVCGLLAAGADPDERCAEGEWTPLQAAVSEDHLLVVEALLNAGASVDERNADGVTALQSAVRASGEVVAVLLAAGADPTSCDTKFGWSALDGFVNYDNAAALSLVIQAGADPDPVDDEDGYTPLADAAEAGSAAAAEVLLAAGADPTRRFEGLSASELAAQFGHHALAARLAAAADEAAADEAPR